MSKKVKSLVERDIKSRLGAFESVAVIGARSNDATKVNVFRRKLRAKGARMLVVKNTLAKRALGSGKLAGFDKLLDGPSALVYGNVSMPEIARFLVDEKKADAKLELRGILFDGEVYVGEKGVEAASKLPTRDEAIASLVGMIVGPGRRLGGIFKGQAGKVAALVKAVEEKKAKEA
jgi:large subunit ribosomal protein L10